ncbi:hypothetical protein DUNSADRAFT_7268 [Dunaliella salina]|nr:hypothetical protein DUNSADRAFT_7268 [Dunaliella salina]|eukprot:KAF5835530.1 hypothetical protein DUNSADRAFT_7268 [Dunaliella salina]
MKMCAEQTYQKAITKEEMIFQIMAYLGRSLSGQKQEHPEKLPRAALLHRQVLDAKLKHREYGPEDGATLWTMNDLRDALSGQNKYVEALSMNQRALTVRKRKYSPSHCAVKENIDRHIEILRLQAAFRAAAEKTDLGPRDTWVGDEDGVPALVMFEKTIQDAKQKRATRGTKGSSTESSRTRNSKFDEPQFSPIEYDPTDKIDVNYAALMAGLGVIGVCTDKMEVAGSEVLGCTFKLLGSHLPRAQKDQASRCWASVISLLNSTLELPTEFSQDSPAGKRIFVLLSAMSMNKSVKELMSDAQPAMQLIAQGSRDAFRQIKEGKEAAAAGDVKLREGIKRPKPMRTCIACGAYGAMKKCSRCKQVYACSMECHVSAWNAFHKKSCVPKPK